MSLCSPIVTVKLETRISQLEHRIESLEKKIKNEIAAVDKRVEHIKEKAKSEINSIKSVMEEGFKEIRKLLVTGAVGDGAVGTVSESLETDETLIESMLQIQVCDTAVK